MEVKIYKFFWGGKGAQPPPHTLLSSVPSAPRPLLIVHCHQPVHSQSDDDYETLNDVQSQLNSPPVVFGVEQEVCTDDGDTDGDDGQDHEHQKHESIDVVDLVRPERREDEIPTTPVTPR